MWLAKSDLPSTVSTKTERYSIITDFRAWIRFENMMIDPGIHDEFKPYFMAKAVLAHMTDKLNEELLKALLSFYRLDKPMKKSTGKTSVLGYRFDYDMDLILAAFMQQYKIDLLSADLHWWEFKSLFDGLTDQTKFVQVVGYRTADIAKLDKEQRKRYQELKEFYALPVDRSQDNSQQELEARLLANLKGGDENAWE